MIKSRFARWFSVVVVGALAVGCGSRSESRPNGSQMQAPAASVTPPADTLTPPVAAAPAATASPSAAPDAKGAKGAQAGATKTAGEKDGKAGTQEQRKVVSGAPLTVKRLVVASSVARDKREPVGEASAFKAADLDRLYAFVEVENPTKAESEVFVTFEPQGEGASQGQVSLRVGASPRWRTWAYTRGIKKPGQWAAVVRNLDGKVIARTPFEVTL